MQYDQGIDSAESVDSPADLALFDHICTKDFVFDMAQFLLYCSNPKYWDR